MRGIVTKDMKHPMELVDGSPVEVDYFWESIASVQLTTSPSWWGNVLQPKTMKVGSEYVDVGPEAMTIDREFLARKEALAIRACGPLIEMGIAKSVSAVCINPEADRIECEVNPELTGVVPTTVVGGDYALEFEPAPEADLIWQDTVDSSEEYQDTVDSTSEIQDVS